MSQIIIQLISTFDCEVNDEMKRVIDERLKEDRLKAVDAQKLEKICNLA